MSPSKSSLRSVQVTALAAVIVAATAIVVETAQADIDDSIRGAPSEANHFIPTPEGWEHPMKPWGEPDIEATLDMMQASRVPLERCADSYRYGAPPCDMDKAWLTEQEFDARMEEWRNTVDRSRQLAAEGDFGGALQAGMSDPNIPQRQTNLIVDPANGLLPALTEEGKRRAREMRSDWALPGEDLTFDRPEDFDSWDRCITRGMPSSMMPYRYNGGFQIVQAPGYVVFNLEMIHEARIIPTRDRAPLPPEIEHWMGGSRGYWDGTTLVVETTSYKEGPPMINLAVVGSPPGNRFPISSRMKTTERITRLNDEWWLYEITTEDPVILTEPFTVRYPMRHDPDYLMPEYACHEANTIVQNYVEISRYERANPKPIPPQEPIEASPAVAESLDGRWVGRPRIVTIDVDIELEFTDNGDGTVNGRLIGTNLGEIRKPLEDFTIDGRELNFTLPNIAPWAFAGEVTEAGTIAGVVSSSQGGLPVTFSRVSETEAPAP